MSSFAIVDGQNAVEGYYHVFPEGLAGAREVDARAAEMHTRGQLKVRITTSQNLKRLLGLRENRPFRDTLGRSLERSIAGSSLAYSPSRTGASYLMGSRGGRSGFNAGGTFNPFSGQTIEQERFDASLDKLDFDLRQENAEDLLVRHS